jgi:transposase
MIKLTPRQRAFLDKLRDLYRERRKPVHYSAVAQRLGVSKFSAYDMLRVLEQKGVAASEYLLSAERSGPGRSQVVFYPTVSSTHEDQAAEGDEDWLRFKQRLLNELQEARDVDYREKLTDFLSRLPDLRAPLEYCAETIAALLLNLDLLKDKVSERNPLRSLSSLLTAGEAGLSTLAGLSLGSMLMAVGESSLTERLLTSIRHYQDHLSRLSEGNKERLTDFLREALTVFQRPEAQADALSSS